jgi:hypothetical protein
MQGRTSIRQVVLATLGACAGVAVIVGLIVVLSGSGTDGGPASGVGWTIPIASVFVIIGVTWLLLSQSPRDHAGESDLYAPCPTCGHSVLRDWRLCPYCGAMLDRPDAAGTSGTPERG